MTKEELEKISDEWSIKFAEECVNICCGTMSIKMAPTDIVRTASKISFKAAFSSATSLLIPEIEKLQDKLYHESRRADEVQYVYSQFIDRMKELGQAMPPNAISMNIQKALAEIRKKDDNG